MKFKDLRKLKGVPADLTDKQLLAWLIIQIFKRKKRRKQQQVKAIKPGVNPPKLTGVAMRSMPTEAEQAAKTAYFKKPDVQPPIQINIPNPNVPKLEAPKEAKQKEEKHGPAEPGKRRVGLPFGNAEIVYDPTREREVKEQLEKYSQYERELHSRQKREAQIIKQKHEAEDRAEREERERQRLANEQAELLRKQRNEYEDYIWYQTAKAMSASLGKSKKPFIDDVEAYAKKAFADEKERKAYIENWSGQSVRDIILELGPIGELDGPRQAIFDKESTRLFKQPVEAARFPLVAKHGYDPFFPPQPPKTPNKTPLKGHGMNLPDELDTFQIDTIMKPYPHYKGTIAHDEVVALLPLIKPRQSAAFIINTDNHDQRGQHWQAINISYPDQSVEFFDSFGRRMHRDLWPGLKQLLKKIDAPFAWKFKENRKEDQDANSDNCGYFCIEFLVNRFKGKSFAEATKLNEREIEDFKHRFGPFKWIALKD